MKKNKSVKILCIALAMILVGSLCACLLQTDFFKVRVRDIYITTSRQQNLHATLYVPVDASAENPCPIVVTCHGWGDNSQMQSSTGMELSRRGIAVLAMDAYSHGQSSNVPENIIIDSRIVDGLGMIAAVEYCASGIMDFVDTDRIGLMGHSMGGSAIGGTLTYFGEQYTAAYAAAQSADSDEGETVTAEEQAYCDSLYPVSATLSTGNSDETVYSSFDTLKCNFGILICTNECYNVADEPYYVGIDKLMATIGLDDYETETYYGDVEEGTLRVCYQPFGTHPMLPIMPNSMTKILEFWDTSFGFSSAIGYTNHVYLLKELCTLIALIGLIMAIVPITELLLKAPCFERLRGVEGPKVPALSGKRKTGFYIGLALCVLVSFGACLFAYLYFSYGSHYEIFPAGMVFNSYIFSATQLNPILVMTVVSTIWLAFWFLVNYLHDKKKGIRNADMLGWKIKGGDLGRTVGLSAVVIGLVYTIVFFIFWLFKTDFRLYNISIQTFGADKLWTALWYLPFFFLFYLVDALFINGALRLDGMSEKKNMALATIANGAGLILFFIVQYVGLFIRGRMYTFTGDWGCTVWIVMCGWQLLLAPYLLRKFYQLTGKNWLGPIVVSTLFVIVGVANTAISCYLF